MQFIRDIYREAQAQAQKRRVFSFEFFTPRTEEGDRILIERTLPALCQSAPAYCSVTYGAGGSTREKTLGLVEEIQRAYQVPGMAHLTCVGSTREQIVALLEEARRRGIRNLLALRGDPPMGSDGFVRPAGGFAFAHELVSLTRQVGGFSVGVAGFPEGHIECREGREVDWQRLKAKIDCGADYVITQLFFDNEHYYRFRDYLVGRLGVAVPIVPGVVPILSASQIKKFVALCGASIPQALASRLDALGADDAAVAACGIEFATRQCADLLRQGAPGVHFYTLNKAGATTRILQNLRD